MALAAESQRGPPSARAEVYEMIAISHYELGQPQERVLENFDKALALDPKNDRIKENRALAVAPPPRSQGGRLGRRPHLPAPPFKPEGLRRDRSREINPRWGWLNERYGDRVRPTDRFGVAARCPVHAILGRLRAWRVEGRPPAARLGAFGEPRGVFPRHGRPETKRAGTLKCAGPSRCVCHGSVLIGQHHGNRGRAFVAGSADGLEAHQRRGSFPVVVADVDAEAHLGGALLADGKA